MPDLVMPLVFMAFLLAMFYFFFSRPQLNRQREQQDLQSGVGVGDQVMLISGVYARVTARDGEDLELEIADGVRIQAAQVAVLRRVDETASEADSPHESTQADANPSDPDEDAKA